MHFSESSQEEGKGDEEVGEICGRGHSTGFFVCSRFLAELIRWETTKGKALVFLLLFGKVKVRPRVPEGW